MNNCHYNIVRQPRTGLEHDHYKITKKGVYMTKQVNGYTIIADYNTHDIMVELYGIWHNARHALACQAYWDLYKATFGEEC